MEPFTDREIVVLGLFKRRAALETCVDLLRSAGFRKGDVSALFPFGASNMESEHEARTNMQEGAATGSASDAVLGGALGWLSGIETLVIPGVGPLIAAGPIVAALSGVGVSGDLGGITGGLVGLGFPEVEARRYEAAVKNAGNLLSVHCDNIEWADSATITLESSGAEGISRTYGSESAKDASKHPFVREDNKGSDTDLEWLRF